MNTLRGHFIVDAERLTSALRAKGYRSFRELAKDLGIHRNTISNYLSGAPPLPDALERILLKLELSPAEILRRAVAQRRFPALTIAQLIDRLNSAAPDCTFVLFGSRARGKAKKFSDYDVGVFRSNGLGFTEYSRLLNIAEEWNDSSFENVQVANLTVANDAFLTAIRDDLEFLSGSPTEWLALQQKCGIMVTDGSKMD